MSGDPSPAPWWRGREWRCTSCERPFRLWRPTRVKDFRGHIAEAVFVCPRCGRHNPLNRSLLDRYERQDAR